ncbi:MAG: hypothetical protein JNK58_13900 [Phycisphaerae bacterium]|nr:hypothetical protein [Phycisphaerae bacterium]
MTIRGARGISLAWVLLLGHWAAARQCGVEPSEPVQSSEAGPGLITTSRFGAALDFDGARLMVGDPCYTAPGGPTCAGAVYVFERDESGEWIESAMITAPAGQPITRFGDRVAIDNDIAIVRALLRTPSYGNVGVVLLYDRSALGAWNLRLWLGDSQPDYSSLFGIGLDIEGPNMAIAGECAVQTYRRFGPQITPGVRLSGFCGPELSGVFVSPNWLMAFTYGFDWINGMRGYMYEWTGSAWTPRGSIRPAALPEHSSGSYFAAMDGDIIAISSPTYNVNGFGSEAVWVFRLADGQWKEEATIRRPDDLAPRTGFGSSVAVADGVIVVGASGVDAQGAVIVFERTELGWLEKGRVLASQHIPFGFEMKNLGASATARGGLSFAGSPTTNATQPGAGSGAVMPIRIDGSLFAIGSHPAGQTAMTGQTVSLSASASGPGVLTYQWLRNGVPIEPGGRFSGVTGTALTISNAMREDTALYSLAVTSSECGTLETRGALVQFDDCLLFDRHPASSTPAAGARIELDCEVHTYFPVAYRWFRSNGSPLQDDGRISGSEGPRLVIDPSLPIDRTGFYVTASNACGTRASQVGSVTFESCVNLVHQPESVYTFAGDTAIIRVDAAGEFPLTYRWYSSFGPVVESAKYRGTRTSVLSITDVSGADENQFRCEVSCGYTESTTEWASLTVFDRACLGDANRDRRVDMVDLSTVLQEWDRDYRPGTGVGDASFDGRVNFRDLTMVLSQFGNTCQP